MGIESDRRWWNLVPQALGWMDRPPGWVAAKSTQRLAARITWLQKSVKKVVKRAVSRRAAKPTEDELFAAARARARAEMLEEQKHGNG